MLALLVIATVLAVAGASVIPTTLLRSPVDIGPCPVPYAHSAFLDAARTVEFKWSVGNSRDHNLSSVHSTDGTNDVLVAELSAPTLGWMAWGMSPNGGMPGANMLVMWVDDATGVVHVQDRYANDTVEPLLVDDSSSQPAVLNFTGTQNATHTTVQFVRWLNAGCSNQNDLTITSNAIHVIYAYGDSDADADGHIQYHGPENRGGQTLYLLDDQSGQFEINKAAALRDGKPYNYTADNFPVPDIDTLYQCTFYQMPEITGDSEIVGFEAIVAPGNEDIIHHFLVHMCDEDIFSENSPPPFNNFSCYDTPAAKLGNASKCLGNEFWAWGVGGSGTYFPQNIGYPISSKFSRRYFLLEIHYNNPALHAGRIDNSGFRILMSDTAVRPQATSLFLMYAAANPTIVIPGNRDVFVLPGTLHKDCTEKFVPETGTQIFSVFLHSHLLGQAMVLRHFREGVEMPPIISDETYDFNYQQYRPTNATLLPGDTLMLECNYSSTQRTHRSVTTLGGLSTSQEMCVAAMFVTPPIPLLSSINYVNNEQLLVVTNATDIPTPPNANATQEEIGIYFAALTTRFKSIVWDESAAPLADRLQEFYLNSQQTYGCVASDGETLFNYGSIQPNGKHVPYQPPQTCTTTSN